LELKLSAYPDFNSLEQYRFRADFIKFDNPVEVDIYEDLVRYQQQKGSCKALLGIDIGSTSTKAVLMDRSKNILVGVYTRTAGRPALAVQNLFAAMHDIMERKQCSLNIVGAGTTGSGRKFSGRIIGADLIIDEITAHARAAFEISPDVDTILEIGGQDSKFTTLQKGMVTFSIMNTVCAAGTGSFIEEQARKLGCPLTEYSQRTEGKQSPITSDRCTVFMERDMNYYLSKGYHTDEILASVLHAIRENYLTKVAIEDHIGQKVLFQGATAKNKALVAAFEQRLQKPIHVSKYCHLTGAIGVALKLTDQNLSQTTFRGLELYRKQIPIRSEVCELCTNHCKISVANVEGQNVAYGFLCGRDYDTRKFVNNNISGFDLLKSRRRIFTFKPQKEYSEPVTIGIPAALHMMEDLVFWRIFFDELGIRTITSEDYMDAVKAGKRLAGAEFCAPITAMYGHIQYLMDKSDIVFLPFYLDHKGNQNDVRRQYCYYTQFAPSLAAMVPGKGRDGRLNSYRLLTPLVYYLYSNFHTRVQLYKSVKAVSRRRIKFSEITAAFDKAAAFKENAFDRLRHLYQTEAQKTDRLHVVLLGRPYNILSKAMHKGIPNMFASLGIKTFFQDMLPYDKKETGAIEPLLNELHWHYSAKIMEAAADTAQSKDAYPVLVTSFKCSPDSFVIDYFKRLMESYDKPYLILQLDEHDSSVGYETRIEAAIRSFKNHHDSVRTNKVSEQDNLFSWKPAPKNKLTDKTLVIPNWDHLSLSLVVATLRREGIDARLLEETRTSIQKSLRYNTGQCIPLNIIAQEFMDYIENHALDPAKTVLWTATSAIPCNLRLFPSYIKRILQLNGKGFEQADVYPGVISFADLSMKLPINTYFAYMFGGMIKKIGCQIRPYEAVPGATDEAIQKSLSVAMDAFLGNHKKTAAAAEIVALFDAVETTIQDDGSGSIPAKPKVCIFGDLYARDNEIFNQNLIHKIESHGGEVVTTPYSSFVKMIAKPYLRKWFVEGNYLSVLSSKALITTITRLEKRYLKYFSKILKDPEPDYNESPKEILARYNVRIEHTGESMDNILKIFYTIKHHPDVSLFVQTSPAFCCPSLVTEAMATEIERQTGVPIVSITYDGTGGDKNDIVVPYLKYPKGKTRKECSPNSKRISERS
jgi:predicted CoA-substrate-specific enzyme activase